MNDYNKSNLPQRKPNRLNAYDYSENGCYFVTVCTKDRKNILSRISAVGGDDLGAPKKISLKPYGKTAEQYILSMGTAYPDITVENYIIMPNHIHLLITIDKLDFTDNCGGTPRSSSPTISSLIGAFKRFTNKQSNQILWQRGFYDHIIRNEDDFLNTWNYIEYNALKEYGE